MHTDRSATKLQLITIPSSDRAFRAHVVRVAGGELRGPVDLERHLRRIFPRVVVRERSLSGEAAAWYVYRDGGWQSPGTVPWWDDESMPRAVVTADGWFAEVSQTAAGILGIDAATAGEHHFTDFVVPGTLADTIALFDIVQAGSPLTATVRLRPISGDVIAVDFHAERRDDELVAVFRLATDVDGAAEAQVVSRPAAVTTSPSTDVAFRAYALRALDRMPEPTLDGLELRLRRLYPHAAVRADGETWVAERDPRAGGLGDRDWWRDERLPRVHYDAQALILDANDAARGLLGHDLVGHYWQDFVTPGSSDEVAVMLAILREVGAAESRFRMPRADGHLVEFDSYTAVEGEEFVTIMRPTEP